MARGHQGSLTKEPPLAKLEATIRAITPGMAYKDLLKYARIRTHRDAPGLVRKRYLLVGRDGVISYDHFLSLTRTHRVGSAFIRKVMYFVWAYRDERIRRFICERIADKSGRWRASQIENKDNSKFFERWAQPSTARKARSNLEYFLVETGIYNKQSKTTHLELKDGWFEQAVIVAAQHEANHRIREELLANPIAFLEKRNWLGLLNASPGSIAATSPLLLADASPQEDEAVDTAPSKRQTSAIWDRTSPVSSGRQTTTATIDLVSRERANRSHYLLEKELAAIARKRRFTPRHNQNIDLYFETSTGTVLIEIKSCTDTNFHSQARKGISQLFEYRFLYPKLIGPNVTMLLVMETKPPRRKMWLVEYVRSLGVTMAWRAAQSRAIVTAGPISASLRRIVSKA